LREGELTFTFNRRLVAYKQGDTISAALWRNDIKIITRSLKFHRPRGLYCGNGDCPNCLANVDGVPNVRTCTTLAENGMQVTMQNKFLSTRIDPITVIDHIFPRGVNYHHRFIRPRFMTGVYQGIIRRMTGIGKLPTMIFEAKPTKRIVIDALIIGEEPQSMKIARTLADENLKIMIVKNKIGYTLTHQNDEETNSILSSADSIEHDLSERKNVKIIWKTNAIGAFDDGTIGISSKDRLYICKSKIISLSEKGREQPIRFVNWELPGIIQRHAALDLISQNIRLGKRVVVAGEPNHAKALGELMLSKGINVTAIIYRSSSVDLNNKDKLSDISKIGWRIKAAIGRNELRKIIIANDSKQMILPCDCLVTCGPAAPNIDLAKQLGCGIETDRKSFPIVTVNGDFETMKGGVFAVGSVCGLRSRRESWEAASTAGKAVTERLRRMGT